MRAVRISETGGPEVLTVDEVDTPEPGEGQARVEVVAAGLNFIDTYQRAGAYPVDLPFTPGVEGAGTVSAVGPGVEDVEVGDRVAWTMVPGAYAEEAVVPVDRLVPVPAQVDLQSAAAVMLQGMTAHYLTHTTAQLEEGDSVLVHAAGGGVGQLLVQLAVRRGARVIGTASTQDKRDLAAAAGAAETVDYTSESFVEAAKRFTDGHGVDVVYDGVGAATFADGLDCLRPRGMMVLFGQASGPVEPLDPQTLNAKGSLFLTRPSLAHYVADRDELLARASDLFDWIGAGGLRVRIDREFPLADAPESHRYIEDRQTRGKVLLVP